LADPFDELDFDYVSGVAEKAMSSLIGQRVPPTPHNFHVWFRYALGTPVALKRTVDILIANKRKFDAATNDDLYTTYIGSKGIDEAVAHQVSQQLHDVLASAQKFLSTAIADNRTQIEAINSVADRSESGTDPHLLVETLMNELSRAAMRATRLEAEFVEKSRELDIIRQSLSQSEEPHGPTA
jgi:diguanylate cyclase